MKWTQGFEAADLDSLDDLHSLVDSLETDGNIERVEVTVVADQPINANPETASTQDNLKQGETSHKYSVDNESTTTSPSPDTSPSEPEPTETTPDTDVSPVAVRKWPRMSQELGTKSDLPISAAAYPAEVKDFTQHDPSDVEQDTLYHARVNGTKEYGAFVTLNGSGYSPNSKYNEVTGLVHHSEMIRKGPLEYSQGDTIVVQLIDNTEKGLAFREQPLLTTEQAKQARHSEVVRLNRLNLEPGDDVVFSDWPAERERTGTVESIEHGSEDPIRPPAVIVTTPGDRHRIRPSEVVASTQPTPATVVRDSMMAANGSTDTQTVGDTAEITIDSPQDEDDDDEAEFRCACGETFDSGPQMWGHQSSCNAYQAEQDEDNKPSKPAANESNGGRVLNPVLLDPRYQYSKTAIALYRAPEDELSAGELADRLEDTEWEVERSNINTHLESLREKDAATRNKSDVYRYSLTDRGAAGAERAIEELDAEEEIPAL